MAKRGHSLAPVPRLQLGLSEGGIEQGETLVLLDELGENLLRLFWLAARRQCECIAVLHADAVLTVVDAHDELLRDVGIGVGRNDAHALTDELVAL